LIASATRETARCQILDGNPSALKRLVHAGQHLEIDKLHTAAGSQVAPK
jgi:hypothetical protein